jgi:hypothetical protein
MAGGPTRVIERLIDDDYVHEQLGAGVERLGAAYRRACTLRRQEALQDRKLYRVRVPPDRPATRRDARSASRSRSPSAAAAGSRR